MIHRRQVGKQTCEMQAGRRQGGEQTGELQARLEKLCKRARKEGKEWLKGELKKEVGTLKRTVANEGRDGLQRALAGVKWEQLRPLMLQAGMGSEHVAKTLSLAELLSRFVEHLASQAGPGGRWCVSSAVCDSSEQT